MPFDAVTRHETLRNLATSYVNLAIENIEREYPNMPWMIVTEPGPLPTHRELHPTFYGSFDWHSCVEMFWVSVRLLRLFPNDDAQQVARQAISKLITDDHIAIESAFFTGPDNRGFERPYGWGWLLTLQAELDSWDDPDGQRWAAALKPLSLVLAERFIEWLPLLTYPYRNGMHSNTAFGLLRSLDFASSLAASGDSRLLEAIKSAGLRYFSEDANYPAHYEPSGADFLSAALTEAELMSRLLPGSEFAPWLDRFLPGLVNHEPVQLFTPAVVSDLSDGHIAHLAGLNLSRSAGYIGIANALPADDRRVPVLISAANVHADASLSAVTGSDYMVEHWLAAYATLLLTA